MPTVRAKSKNRGVYHKAMVYMGFRSALTRARTKKRLVPSRAGPAPVIDNDFAAAVAEDAVAKQIAEEVKAALEKHVKNAPAPAPTKTPPSQYAKDAPLKPMERRPKPYKWMEAPDVAPAGVGGRPRVPKDEFVVSEHATSDHVVRTQKQPLAERDYGYYVPGTGPAFGGPSFPEKTRNAALVTSSATANTTQFLVLAVAITFAPLAFDLMRTISDGEVKVSERELMSAFEDVSAAAASGGERGLKKATLDLLLRFLRFCVTAAAVAALGFLTFGVMQRPFSRWLVRVSNATGVSTAGSLVAAAGIGAVVGCFGACVTQAVSTAVKWLLVGKGWMTFISGAAFTCVAVVYQNNRHRRRFMFKRALTALYDVEKSPEGLAALMGAPGSKDPAAFGLGVKEAPAWARFRPDELADWLNGFLERAWPFYNRSICNAVRTAVEPLLEEHRPSMFRRIYFEKLDLGAEPIRVPKVTWVGERSDGMGASLELDLAWTGRAKIVLNAKTSLSSIKIGIKDVEVYTKVQVTLQPLIPAMCPFGGLIVTLKEKPTLDFDIDLPLGLEGTVSDGIQDWLEGLIETLLEDFLVWPERLVIPMADPDLPVTMPTGETVTHQWYVDNVLHLRNTGLICVTVKNASDVVGTDVLSKADSYVRMHVKPKSKSRTRTVPNNNDPKWDETFYMLVDDVNQRALTLQMMDADESGAFSDAVLATRALPLGEMNLEPNVARSLSVDFPETEARNGSKPITKANVDVTYIPFDVEGGADSPAARRLKGVGMLTVTLVKADGIKGADSSGTSDAFARLSMVKAVVGSGTKGARVDKDDSITFNSKTQEKTTDPVFNETFEFVCVSRSSPLFLQMFDRDKGYIANSKKSLGKVEIDIAKSVVQASGTKPGSMEPSVVEAAFKLKGDATIKGTVTLKLAWQPFSARG